MGYFSTGLIIALSGKWSRFQLWQLAPCRSHFHRVKNRPGIYRDGLFYIPISGTVAPLCLCPILDGGATLRKILTETITKPVPNSRTITLNVFNPGYNTDIHTLLFQFLIFTFHFKDVYLLL